MGLATSQAPCPSLRFKSISMQQLTKFSDYDVFAYIASGLGAFVVWDISFSTQCYAGLAYLQYQMKNTDMKVRIRPIGIGSVLTVFLTSG